MPCDPVTEGAEAKPRRRSLLSDMLVVFGLLPPYVVFYPFIWARNRMRLAAWKRAKAEVLPGRWRLEGEALRLCLSGEEHVLELSSIREADWTEHILIRRFVGADASEFLVRLEQTDGTRRSVVLSGLEADDEVFEKLRALGKLSARPRAGGQEQGVGTMALFAAGSAVAWAAIVFLGLWLRGHG